VGAIASSSSKNALKLCSAKPQARNSGHNFNPEVVPFDSDKNKCAPSDSGALLPQHCSVR
jgi:hypothetical protein